MYTKSPEARPALRRNFEYVLNLNAEAPIHESLLFKRFAENWRVGRVGSRIRENAEAVLERVRVDGAQVVKDRSGFYRITDRSIQAARVPVDGVGSRTVLQLPPEEVDFAVTGS